MSDPFDDNPWSTPGDTIPSTSAIEDADWDNHTPEKTTLSSDEEQVSEESIDDPVYNAEVEPVPFSDSNPWGISSSSLEIIPKPAIIPTVVPTDETLYQDTEITELATEAIINTEIDSSTTNSNQTEEDDPEESQHTTIEDVSTESQINDQNKEAAVETFSAREEELDEEDVDEDGDDDFGSFESTEVKQTEPIPDLTFTEYIDSLLSVIFPQKSGFNASTEPESTDNSTLLSIGNALKDYGILVSRQRQYKYSEVQISNFRSRDFISSSKIHNELQNISKEWTSVEKHIATDFSQRQKQQHTNLFSWSTTSQVSEQEKKPDLLKKMPQQVNQKLLKLAFSRSRKIIEERQAIVEQNRIRLIREKRERDERIRLEKQKREEASKKYRNPDEAPAGSDIVNKSKKSIFSKLFGNGKSRIASDSLSHDKVMSPTPEASENECNTELGDDDILFKLETTTDSDINNDLFGDFNDSDEDEDASFGGYNQINFDENDDPNEKDDINNNSSGNKTASANDDSNESFEDSLQTPIEANPVNLFDDLSISPEIKELPTANKTVDSELIPAKPEKSTENVIEDDQEAEAEGSATSPPAELTSPSKMDLIHNTVEITPTLKLANSQSSVEFVPNKAALNDNNDDADTVEDADDDEFSDFMTSPPPENFEDHSLVIQPTPILMNRQSSFKIPPNVPSQGTEDEDEDDDDDEFSDFMTPPPPESAPLPQLTTRQRHASTNNQIRSQLYKQVASANHSDSSDEDWGDNVEETLKGTGGLYARLGNKWASFGSMRQTQLPKLSSNFAAPNQNAGLNVSKRQVRSISTHSFKDLPPRPASGTRGNSTSDIPEDLVPASNSISSFYHNSIISTDDRYSRSGSISRKGSVKSTKSANARSSQAHIPSLIDL